VGLALLCFGGGVHGATIADLARSLREALAAHKADAAVAVLVSGTKLSERLEEPVIEQLQSEGAGPQAVEELEQQRGLTARLPAPKQLSLFDAPPAPSSAEQARVLDQARSIAAQYSAGLPNFLCTETVRRYGDRKNKGNWQLRDTLTVSVAYTEKGERYKLIGIDGQATDKTLARVGGFKSNGEFGSVLRIIFDPQSAAAFHWERWTNLRGKPALVFSYFIDRAHSKYTLDFNRVVKRYRMVSAMRGLVYLDRDTSQVMRFSLDSVDLPADWPIRDTPAVLDYAYAEVAGQKYLLPWRVDSRVVMKDGQDRNVTEFREYRKFAGEATVSFDK
jgi:hypothetical protein